MVLPVMSSVGNVASNRASSLASNIGQRINPKQVISQGVDSVKGQLFSEMPELSGITSSIGSFISDITRDLKKSATDDKTSKESDANIKLIKEETVAQTSIFDMLANWMESIDSNLHGSPPYLLTIKDGIEELNGEVVRLTDITADALEIDKKQLELERDTFKYDKSQDKRSKFVQQKEKAKIEGPVLAIKDKEKTGKKHPVISWLGTSFLGRLLTGFGAILEPLVLAMGYFGRGQILAGIKALAPGTKGDKTKKPAKPVSKRRAKRLGGVLDSQGSLKDPKTGKFTTVDKLKAAKKAGKGTSKFAKVGAAASKVGGGFAKVGSGTVGKAAKLSKVLRIGPLALLITAFEGLMGGIKAGAKSHAEGNDAKKVIADALTGAVKGIITGIIATIKLVVFDLPKLIGGVFVELGANLIAEFNPEAAKEFKKIMNSFGKLLTDIKDTILNNFKSLSNWIINETPVKHLFSKEKRKNLTFDIDKPGALTPQSQSSVNAESLYADQQLKTYNDLQNQIKAAQAANAVAEQSNNTVIAPTSTTNNIFRGNLQTRNPDTPVRHQRRI